MKYALLGLIAWAALIVALNASCTTVEVVQPTATPTSVQKTQEASYMEQEWIDNWTKDGSSATEGRCMWQAMIGFYGSEAKLLKVIATVEPADMWGELDDDPAFDACWESY